MNLKLKNFIIRIIEIKAETVFQAAICTEKFNFRSKTIFFGIISNRNLDRDVGSLVSKKNLISVGIYILVLFSPILKR